MKRLLYIITFMKYFHRIFVDYNLTLAVKVFLNQSGKL